MNKKAFTLIEMLAVIVLLGILSVLVTVSVSKIKKKQDEKNKENTISAILSGAKKYATDKNISTGNVPVRDLLNGNYVDFDLNEYGDLEGKTVSIAVCDNKNKREFVLEGYTNSEGKKYNDCGCNSQTLSESISTNLCTE